MRIKRLSYYLLLTAFMVLLVLFLSKNMFMFNRVNAIAKDESIIAFDVDDSVDIDLLKRDYQNDEIIGVLRIPDTKLNVIFTQAGDNNKYLTTNIYGENDVTGNPFIDYRVDIDKSLSLLIYGHNSKTYDVPFKELENYYSKDYYDDHPYIELITQQGLWRYKIFSVYVETKDWYYLDIDFDNKDDWLAHLNKLKGKSMYDTGEDISPDDRILILQTCSFKKELENYDKKYLLIIARRVY